MKVRVNRKLSGGYYHVNFEVGDFTPDEVQKMGSFGVPNINLLWGGGVSKPRNSGQVPLNQISNTYDIAFTDEAEAKKYEETVLKQIRDAVERLRESQDKFSSSEEVSL
jgi:hypothetical protein